MNQGKTHEFCDILFYFMLVLFSDFGSSLALLEKKENPTFHELEDVGENRSFKASFLKNYPHLLGQIDS